MTTKIFPRRLLLCCVLLILLSCTTPSAHALDSAATASVSCAVGQQQLSSQEDDDSVMDHHAKVEQKAEQDALDQQQQQQQQQHDSRYDYYYYYDQDDDSQKEDYKEEDYYYDEADIIIIMFNWTEDDEACYLEHEDWYSHSSYLEYWRGTNCQLDEEDLWYDDDLTGDESDGDDEVPPPFGVHWVDPREDAQLKMAPLEAQKYWNVTEQPHFLVPKNLRPGEVLHPIPWRDTLEGVDDDEILAVGLPPELWQEFRTYFSNSGVLELVQELIYGNNDDALLEGDYHYYDDQESHAWTLLDGHKWSVKRADHWDSDMVWLDPIDETCYESLRGVLRRGNFDVVLQALQKQLKQPNLVVHGVGAIFVGRFDGDAADYDLSQLHRDVPDSRGAFYNVLVPVYLPDDPEQDVVLETGEVLKNGPASLYIGGTDGVCAPIHLKYNVATVVGSDSWHGTGECDYLDNQGFRLSMSIWVSEITDEHLETIATDGLSPWPRHDHKEWYRAHTNRTSFANDTGRAPIDIVDTREDCEAVKDQCETDLWGVRQECSRTCGVYMTTEEYYPHLKALRAADGEAENA